jgi:hypothetical protein
MKGNTALIFATAICLIAAACSTKRIPVSPVQWTATMTQTCTRVFSATRTLTRTETPFVTATATQTVSGTFTATATATPSFTHTPTATVTMTFTVTQTPTTLPAASRLFSGNFYTDTGFATPVQGVSVTAYEVDGSALRTGAAESAYVSDSSGYFALLLTLNKFYEIEVLKTGIIGTAHYYIPQVTGDKTGLQLTFSDITGMQYVTGGGNGIFYTGGMIYGTDTVTFDGGGNLNDTTASDGTGNALLICKFIIPGNAGGLINVLVSDSAFPGDFHTVSFNGDVRNSRVQLLSALHYTICMYY